MYYITADATCDFPEGYDIPERFYRLTMPYSIGIDNYVHNSKEALSLNDFYNRMRCGATPVTSCVTPHTAKALWAPTLRAGYDILHISFSSALSATYNNQIIAAKELEDEFPDNKVVIIDSLSGGAGEAILAINACRNRDKGMSLQDNVDYVESMKQNINHYFIVDDLYHLMRGGRLSHAGAIIGTTIKIKPILTVNNSGSLVNTEKAISRKLAVKKLINNTLAKCSPDTDMIIISHGDCENDALSVKNRLNELLPNVTVLINRTGPMLLSHTGMNLLAVAFRGKNR